MEVVVGIIAHDEEHGAMAFLTWGAIFEGPEALLDAAREAVTRFGVAPNVRLSVARTLHEVTKYPYFYEGLLHFAQRPVPRDGDAEAARAALRTGQTLYGLGRLIGTV
jgi:hypothetical protein